MARHASTSPSSTEPRTLVPAFEDVEAPVGRDGAINQRSHYVRVTYVTDVNRGLSSGGDNSFRAFQHRCLGTPTENNVRATRTEAFSDGAPDAARSARDDSGLTG
jgi:hypothetical protein